MPWNPWTISTLGLAAFVLLGWLSAIYIRGTHRHLKSRVANGLLVFTPLDGGGGSIPVSDITEVIDISSEYQGQRYEIVTCYGQRLVLKVPAVVGGFRVFTQAIQRANPAVRSGVRQNRCHACSADLRIRKDVCPECREPIPLTVGSL